MSNNDFTHEPRRLPVIAWQLTKVARVNEYGWPQWVKDLWEAKLNPDRTNSYSLTAAIGCEYGTLVLASTGRPQGNWVYEDNWLVLNQTGVIKIYTDEQFQLLYKALPDNHHVNVAHCQG